MTRTVYRTCSLCEACCGLRFEVEGDRITAVRPDDDDVLSRGFVCPKGIAIADVHHDPDRIRQPLVRDAEGVLRPASWDAALSAAAGGLDAVRKAHGRDAVAVYMGNPIVHNHGAIMLRSGLLARLGTRRERSLAAGGRKSSRGVGQRLDRRSRGRVDRRPIDLERRAGPFAPSPPRGSGSRVGSCCSALRVESRLPPARPSW